MKTKVEHLLGAALSLLITLTLTHSAAAQNRIVFNTQTTTIGSPKHPTVVPGQIYSMNDDGTDVVQLTSGSTFAAAPSWSPGQQSISFFRSFELRVMEAIGEANGGQTFVVATNVASTGSDWSPDGTMICFPGYSTVGLWIVNVNAATGEAGTPICVREGLCRYPDWSPDGTKIAFTFQPNGSWDNRFIKVLDLVTGAETSFDMITSMHPEWSPDGNWIAFQAVVTATTTKGNKTTTNHYSEIFIANADSTAATQVTNFKGTTGLSSWSPDGRSLAIMREINGVQAIYRMDLTTGDTTFLHDGQGADWNP